MTESYDDIIDLPHHVSKTHPHMSLMDRAAQFAPFATLTGHGAAIKETARLTNRRYELDEYEKDALNNKLNLVAQCQEKYPEIIITYFQPDGKKEGGAYVTINGCVKKINEYERIIYMTDGTKIAFEEIYEIE